MLFQNQGNPLFLLTPLREGRLQALYRAFDSKIISTHAPAGGATCTSPKQGQPTAISTHAPAGGATRGCGCCCASCRNFYSRPCGRGDEVMEGTTLTEPLISTHAPAGGATDHRRRALRRVPISTHAPAGGATGFRHDKRARFIISTHAPAGGATPPQQPAASGRTYFYSRPCGRGDSSIL